MGGSTNDNPYQDTVEVSEIFLDYQIIIGNIFDVEASKTTGLVNRFISEKDNPKAGVFWNGEFAQTALLASHGILAKYKTPFLGQETWSDPENRWSALGGRARVLISNREKLNPDTVPLIAGCPNPDNGKNLIDYLLRIETKENLAQLGWFHIINGHVQMFFSTEKPLSFS